MTELSALNGRGLVLVGCGRMGSALLQGWLKQGLAASAVHVIDPNPRPELSALGISVNGALPADPAVLVIAVKPQMMADVLPRLAVGESTLVVSVAAGVTLAAYERAFPAAPIVRAMPNTPAAIGQGVSAIIGNAKAGAAELELAEALMSAVGRVVRLESEGQMDAVTALSGSGPAYVFHMIEAMAAAGEAEGLPPALALELARATVAGAGALAVHEDEDPARLREAVTSPGGTTAAGLKELMDPETGLPPLMRRTIAAAAERGRELGK
ncbi:pyrroline-5-carboxylate reductase [Paracoccus kondratievae]|uniref:Pyrroline-5-carboxylate reductase n=2 Tax=Paracoccus TaxID=265 RepID=A0AAD3P187_9RHOB|nr:MULTISPECIES: pyrroline-5-carboxylate reductase [Paracoccus]QFQ86460.1 pyrroline-5-carboxylate reductase [Paracoccus kondratievae]GLK65800.1 pyrroline-5-carboxylate reductase [Paracoccus kondratievae]SMG10180.1 pyrroline-5-carboxylate reductase [Paracoccus sp. J56]